MLEKKLDPATMQSAGGIPRIEDIDTKFQFSEQEIEVLRSLAKEVAEIAERPEQKEKAHMWTQLNDLKSTKPMVFADPENGWNEIIKAETLECQDPLARVWEIFLRKQIFWANEIKDDKVIEPYFDVPYCYGDTGWGMEIKREGGENGGCYHIIPPVEDYERDFPKLSFPKILIDHEASEKMMSLAQEVFGDLLKVRRKTIWWWSLGMTRDFIDLRGLDNFLMDLILYPEWVHKMMAFLRDGYMERLNFLEENGYLDSNTESTYVGSGGFGWTEQLPGTSQINGKVTTQDLWGFCESQETIGVSPEMFDEFIMPYQLTLLERFGLNCYGCCEPINVRWEYVKHIPRLRRVSASHWADKSVMAKKLGRAFVISAKPSPTPLSRPKMNEADVRDELRSILEETKGCVVELIMKDNHTLGNEPKNITRWVEIAREEIKHLYS